MWPFLASLVHTLSLRLWRFFELIMLIDIQHNIIQSNHDYFRDLIVISKGEGKIRTFWLCSNLVLPDILNNSFQKKNIKKGISITSSWYDKNHTWFRPALVNAPSIDFLAANQSFKLKICLFFVLKAFIMFPQDSLQSFEYLLKMQSFWNL